MSSREARARLQPDEGATPPDGTVHEYVVKGRASPYGIRWRASGIFDPQDWSSPAPGPLKEWPREEETKFGADALLCTVPVVLMGTRAEGDA